MKLFFFTDCIIADKMGIFCNIITIFACRSKSDGGKVKSRRKGAENSEKAADEIKKANVGGRIQTTGKCRQCNKGHKGQNIQTEQAADSKNEAQKNTDENSSVLFVLYRIETREKIGLSIYSVFKLYIPAVGGGRRIYLR